MEEAVEREFGSDDDFAKPASSTALAPPSVDGAPAASSTALAPAPSPTLVPGSAPRRLLHRLCPLCT